MHLSWGQTRKNVDIYCIIWLVTNVEPMSRDDIRAASLFCGDGLLHMQGSLPMHAEDKHRTLFIQEFLTCWLLCLSLLRAL